MRRILFSVTLTWRAVLRSALTHLNFTRAPPEFAKEDGVSNSAERSAFSAEFFAGMALECGITPATDPVAAAIEVYKTSLNHALACERLSVLEGSGTAPFGRLVATLATGPIGFVNCQADSSSTVLYAAALGRELLGPLVGNFRASS